MDYFDGHRLPPPFNILPCFPRIVKKIQKLIHRDVIDITKSKKNRTLYCEYIALQERLVKGVFAKIKEQEDEEHRMDEIEKLLKKLSKQQN